MDSNYMLYYALQLVVYHLLHKSKADHILLANRIILVFLYKQDLYIYIYIYK